MHFDTIFLGALVMAGSLLITTSIHKYLFKGDPQQKSGLHTFLAWVMIFLFIFFFTKPDRSSFRHDHTWQDTHDDTYMDDTE